MVKGGKVVTTASVLHQGATSREQEVIRRTPGGALVRAHLAELSRGNSAPYRNNPNPVRGPVGAALAATRHQPPRRNRLLALSPTSHSAPDRDLTVALQPRP
jgi:hypothetical protein